MAIYLLEYIIIHEEEDESCGIGQSTRQVKQIIIISK